MFDIGFWELALIGMLALVMLGPKRLPEAARAAGYWLGRLRTFISNARNELDHHMQGSDMEEIRRLKEELDNTRRYIQEVADKTGTDMARSLDEIEGRADNPFDALESIGGSTGRKSAKKKKAAKKKIARKTVGKATGKTASKKAAGKKSAKKKTGNKKAAGKKTRTAGRKKS